MLRLILTTRSGLVNEIYLSGTMILCVWDFILESVQTLLSVRINFWDTREWPFVTFSMERSFGDSVRVGG